MFGCLAMLKSIADEFNYASIDRFRKVKVFFLNAARRHLHLWSLSYGENNLFDFFRERRLQSSQTFKDKQEFISDLIGLSTIIMGNFSPKNSMSSKCAVVDW
ncbi:unnamed protein product [Rhizopus microsporus]